MHATRRNTGYSYPCVSLPASLMLHDVVEIFLFLNSEVSPIYQTKILFYLKVLVKVKVPATRHEGAWGGEEV
jgi:hypothetical protein